MNTDRIKNIRRQGKAARGQRELIKHLSGDRLTLKQAVNAHSIAPAFMPMGKRIAQCLIVPFTRLCFTIRTVRRKPLPEPYQMLTWKR